MDKEYRAPAFPCSEGREALLPKEGTENEGAKQHA